MSIISAGTSNTTTLVYTGDTTGAMVFQTNGTTEAMRIDTGGNVGIGETSPAGSANYKQLVIRGTSGAELSLKGGSTQYGYVYVDNGGFRIINPQSGSASGTLQFHTSNTERMRIDSDGNFLIARTSPSWANTRFSLDQTTNPAALLSWYNGYPEVYATGNSPSTKFPYSPSGTQEVKNATSSASTVAGYLMDFIAYNGSTATTAYMGVSAGTTYAANMVFGQRTGVQSWQETMRIDTSGRVTIPYQPCFLATRTSGSMTTSGQTVVFNSVQFNTGSHYNSSTGRFTAPIAGNYLFTLSAITDLSATQSYLNLYKNNAFYGISIYAGGPSSYYKNLSSSFILNLAAGDYIEFIVGTNTGLYAAGDGGNPRFAGCLLN